MKSSTGSISPLSIAIRKDLQEQRLSEKIIRKNGLKKEFQKTLVESPSPLKNVSEISLILQIIRRFSNAKDMNTGQRNIIYKSLLTLSFPCMKRAFKALLNLIVSLKKVQIKDKSFRKNQEAGRKIEALSLSMEQVHIVNKYRQIYQEYKNNPGDKDFVREHKSEILLYENASEPPKKIVL